MDFPGEFHGDCRAIFLAGCDFWRRQPLDKDTISVLISVLIDKKKQVIMYSTTMQKGGPMKATVVDLRYHMNDVLKALDRNESVSVLYRGKVKGIIRPVIESTSARVTDHPFFGMCPSGDDVGQVMDEIRGGRHRDI
jgi:hypothetical protein